MDSIERIEPLKKQLREAKTLDEQITIRIRIAQNMHLEKKEESWELLKEIEKELPKIQDELIRGWFYFNKAWHLFEAGETEEALKEFKHSRSYFLTLDNMEGFEGLSASLNGMGNVLSKMGEFDQALPILKKALSLSKQTGNKHQSMTTLINIGRVYGNIKKYPESRQASFEALDYFSEMGMELKKVPLSINIAHSYRMENLPKVAREWLIIAEENPKLSFNDLFHCDYYLEMGYCYLLEENLDEALRKTLDGLELAERKKLKIKFLELNILQAEIYISKNSLDEAENILLNSPEENTDQLHLKKLELLSEIAEKKGHTVQALMYQKALFREYSLIYNQQRESPFAASRLKEMEEQQKRNNTINVIGKEITRMLDMEQLTQRIYASLSELLNVDVLGIGILENGKITFDSFIEMGKKEDGLNLKEDDSESFASWSLKHDRSILINDMEKEKSYYLKNSSKAEKIMGKAIQSLIYIPLHFDGEKIGVFTIQSYHENSYTVEDISLLEALESYISIAMENSRKTKKLENLSELDFLTGIANRRKLNNELNRIVRICRRQKSPVSLLLIDVDYFKRFNDTLGHDKGDCCLKKMAEILKDIFRRPLDIYGRFGGEEFLIIMGETDHDQGLLMAERLRQKINGTRCEFLTEDSPLTISIGGITIEPTELKDLDMENWVKKADQALYKAKESGRNKVCWDSEKN